MVDSSSLIVIYPLYILVWEVVAKWGPMSKKRNDGRERNKEKTTTTKNKERLIEAANNQADATFSGSSQVAAVFTRQFSVTDRSLEREDVRVFFLFFFSFC